MTISKLNVREKLSEANLRKVSRKEVVFNQEFVLKNAFKESNKTGFELMFRYYYPSLCSHAIRIVYDNQAAEDIVSDVFEDFWEKRCDTEMKTSYKSYLYQAVRNKALNYLNSSMNKASLTNYLNEDIINKGFYLTPEDILNFHELTRNLEQAILQLPRQSRRAFQMHRLDGKRYTEVAEELGISVSAVERLISRALKKLKEALLNVSSVGLILLVLGLLV